MRARGRRRLAAPGWAVIIILPHFDLHRLDGRGHTQTHDRLGEGGRGRWVAEAVQCRGGILAAAIFLSSFAAADAFRSLDKWPLEAN